MKKPSPSRNPYDFLAPAQAPDELGRLGSYRVLKLLGKGGMGVVFQAEDIPLKRLVALKVMLPQVAEDPTNRERFLREAQSAAALSHDHIIAIHQVGEERGVPYLAMPLLRGESLDDRLRRAGKLPQEEVLRIGREIADGLDAAHEAGLIHRDVKPANIWLEGSRARVKILDFGLARSVAASSQITQSGVILGTPAYMAPEQARAEKVEGRSDLFALGCVLYLLATGELPFKGSDTISTLIAVAMHEPKPPRDLDPTLSPALADLILHLLAKKPADRPPSARVVADTLTAIEQAQQATQRLATNGSRQKPVATANMRRSRFGIAIAAGLLLLGVGGVTAYFFGKDLETKETSKEAVAFKNKEGKKGGEVSERVIRPEDGGWVPLFNGKDLTGWKVFPNGTGHWKAQNGVIVSDGPRSHLFSERGDYQNFRIRIEARINNGGNSGLYFRTRFDPGLPRGYEAQIYSMLSGDPYKTGSLYGFVPVARLVAHPNEWFTQEVLADNNHIVIQVNGVTTVDFIDPKKTYTQGHIALQQHDPGTVVKFRKIEIRELVTRKP
jgi:serine/threonine protein kinase